MQINVKNFGDRFCVELVIWDTEIGPVFKEIPGEHRTSHDSAHICTILESLTATAKRIYELEKRQQSVDEFIDYIGKFLERDIK